MAGNLKVHELAKKYKDLKSSTISEILENNGVTGKKPQSGLTEDEVAIVEKELKTLGYGKVDSEEASDADKATEKSNAEAKKNEAANATTKSDEKKAEDKVNSEDKPKSEEKSDDKSDDKKPLLKKKKIVIVSGDTKTNANTQKNFTQPEKKNFQPSNNQNKNNSANSNNAPARPSGPIKPRANMIDRAAEATSRREAAEREELRRQEEELRKKQEQEEKIRLQQQKEAEKENLSNVSESSNNTKDSSFNRDNKNNYNNDKNSFNKDRNNGFNKNGQKNGNGSDNFNNRNKNNGFNKDFNKDDNFGRRDNSFNKDNRNSDNRNGFNKDRNKSNGFDRGVRPSRDNQGRGGVIISQGNVGQRGYKNDASKSSFASDVIVPENNSRHKDKNNNKSRDSRSKKDLIYEEDEVTVGIGRNNQAGRFQKPVKQKEEVVEDDIKVIVIPEVVTIKELADKLKLQPSVIVKKFFMQGKMYTANNQISFEEAEELALEYDIICEKEEKVDVIAELLKEDEEDPKNLVPRPPVICVMGHVDHGKTSLLDAIRKTNVTDREAGGITQHIGAYTVNINGSQITFLDTPGHEAFTSMRMRGASSTDIAVLVVAADDGVMPQTVEAINHAKAAGIEIVVAVNKIDKPGANIDRVKQELTEYELLAEDWGGQTIFAPVSAKTGEGIPELLEMILLSAEVLELKANPKRKARGLVLEAELDKGRGTVATVLVQKGTLHVGDFISAGDAHGKVRAMVDDKGRRVKEAGPSKPVEILGLNNVPNAGEIFICHDNDKEAKSYAETFIAQNKEKLLEDTKGKMSLDDLYSKIQEGNLKELNLIIKADVQGSVEAVKQSLVKLSNEEVVVKVIHGGVGAINESDVILASASNAIIIGFNVRPDAMAKSTAEREGVDVRLYKVIYQAIEDIEAAMKGMRDAVYEEKVIGHAEVQQIFKASAIGNIAGARVMDGHIERGCKVRITREGEQIFEGNLASLKRFKDDVKEVKEGFECGLVFEEFDQMQELDMVEAYIMVEVPRD